MGSMIDLGGSWTLGCPEWNGRTIAAELPGDNYSALLAAGMIPDPYFGRNEELVQEFRRYEWEFTREFEVPEELLSRRYVYLNCEMFDTFATVWINGKKAVSTENMFASWRPEVKALLKPGVNTIRIRFKSSELEAKKAAAGMPFPIPMNSCSKVENLNLIRKPHCHGGWDWGITLMAAGVYAPLTLTGVDGGRIDAVWTEQKHEKNRVECTAVAELHAEEPCRTAVTFRFNGEEKTVNASLKAGRNLVRAKFEVKNPRLWWPNGSGAQELYPLTVETADRTVERMIGLRTIEVVNRPDEYGVSMFFRVNGVDVFAKGANWIPADAFPSRQTEARYEDLLESARLANMNMIRVWGGGQYEKDIFYEICDRKGLMVWQDMMFSCSLYPSTEAFIANVMNELDYQIPRLKHHASLAIWCGDNEVIGATKWYDKERVSTYLVNYDRLNRELWRRVEALDPERMFWPSSPCGGPNNFNDGWHDDSCGDMHYWEVWHGAKDFSAYYSVRPRFCSEFGYQSFPSFETVASFCPPDQFNVFSPVMDHHQKCVRGNAPIIGMFGKYFRMPESFGDFLYLSQVQQALAIKTGVEFWRTLKPRCMGTIFWQLNDNWPVASWASIEYGGKWKQLQYHAKRFYAPVIATACRDPQDGQTRIFAVSDLRERCKVTVTAVVSDFDGLPQKRFEFSASLKPGESRCLKAFKPAELAGFNPEEHFMELRLSAECADGTALSFENTFFFDVFKHCAFRHADVKTAVKAGKDGGFEVTLSTDRPAFFVTLDTPGIPGIFSDNSLTLLPGEPKTLVFSPKKETTAAELGKALEVNYLRKTYN